MIKVAIVDDHELIRDGLQQLLLKSDKVEVIQTFSDGKDLVEAYRTGFKADVVLLDIKMKVMDGIETLRQLKWLSPSCCVVIITLFHNPTVVEQALRFGAMGILVKDSSVQEIESAILSAYYGESLVNTLVSQDTSMFNKRQRAIIDLMIQGLSNQDIADKLFLSLGTVKNYTSQIYEKLEVTNRTAAIIKLKEMGVWA